ncbi:hypothetical protein [Maridesulfovibrio ferrireducens]|uniref:hypothetical protein n=1 Tax=Maridesulfovibrio ferrireducens TaxID=246191 RepID=UPI001A2D0889|nr:hypothetical protein [Maridesulfovibrio ferrireducens]MBI9113041.1 hypothetical protein [Maridesulfovibrio ferrireducens]
MIDKTSAIETIMRKLKKIEIGHGLKMLTYKRDRSVVIMRTGEDSFSVTQDGFDKEFFTTDFKELKKLLKKLVKREFPRSNKIRIHEIDGNDT